MKHSDPDAQLLQNMIDANSLDPLAESSPSFEELKEMYENKAVFHNGNFIGNIIIEEPENKNGFPLIRILSKGQSYQEFQNLIQKMKYKTDKI